jgi:hypothetical protein
VLENIGAGEGNRTLVFSLEEFRWLNTFKAHSDKGRAQAPLNGNGFSHLSELAWSTIAAPTSGKPVRLGAFFAAQRRQMSDATLGMPGCVLTLVKRWWPRAGMLARQYPIDKPPLYDLLFKASAETLITIAADPKHLGARVGITSVLHT